MATDTHTKATDMSLAARQDRMNKFYAQTIGSLPDGYEICYGHVVRMRKDVPSRITVEGENGPVDIRGIPYIADFKKTLPEGV